MNIERYRTGTLFGMACALCAATLFALSLVMARVSYDHGTNAQTIMAVRFLLLAVLMFAWIRFQKLSLVVPSRLLLLIFLMGAAYFIGIGSYLASVSWLPVSLAVIIFYTFPILVALASAALVRRRPGLIQMIALALAFFGLVIAIGIETAGANARGLVLACLAALGVTFNMIGSAHVLRHVSIPVFSLYTSVVTASLAIIYVMASGGLALPSGETGWWAFGLMLASFFIAYIANYTGIRLIGPVRLSTVMNLEPVVTIVFAVLLLGEVLSSNHVIGAGIVMAAILLAQYPQLRSIINREAGK